MYNHIFFFLKRPTFVFYKHRVIVFYLAYPLSEQHSPCSSHGIINIKTSSRKIRTIVACDFYRGHFYLLNNDKDSVLTKVNLVIIYGP